jgi:hypothetical protein
MSAATHPRRRFRCAGRVPMSCPLAEFPGQSMENVAGAAEPLSRGGANTQSAAPVAAQHGVD